MFKATARALRDMAYHIDLAVSFTAGIDFEKFKDDLRTTYAVTRCLEIISEASRRPPNDLKARHPAIAWNDERSRTAPPDAGNPVVKGPV